MGLLGTLNKIIGFSDPIKMPQQNSDLSNQMNALRELIAQFQGSTSDRYYDIARNRIGNDAYVQAQQMGQSLNRAMNKRGVLNSGLTAQGQAQVQASAQQGLQQALASLEMQQEQEKMARKAQAINWFTQLLGLETQQDQFNRKLALNTQMQNLQAQNWFANILGDLGMAGGMYWAYGGNPLSKLFGSKIAATGAGEPWYMSWINNGKLTP